MEHKSAPEKASTRVAAWAHQSSWVEVKAQELVRMSVEG